MARTKRKVRRILNLIIISMLVSFSLSSCIPLGSVLELSMEVEDLKDRVDYIEKRAEIVKPTTITEVKIDSKALEETNQKLSELDNRVFQIDSKLSQLDSKSSQLDNKLSQTISNVNDFQKDSESNKSKINTLSNSIADISKR